MALIGIAESNRIQVLQETFFVAGRPSWRRSRATSNRLPLHWSPRRDWNWLAERLGDPRGMVGTHRAIEDHRLTRADASEHAVIGPNGGGLDLAHPDLRGTGAASQLFQGRIVELSPQDRTSWWHCKQVTHEK